MNNTDRNILRKVRAKRSRAKITGSAQRPRLVFYKSAQFMDAQLINDAESTTLIGVTTKATEARKLSAEKRLVWMADKIVAYMKKNAINTLTLDRSGYPYSGNIAQIAKLIREKGITI